MLSSYLYCKRKLYLQYVLQLVEPEKEVMVRGTIRHGTYDKVNKVEEALVKSITAKDDFEAIYKKYLNVYSALLRKTITENKYRLKNVQLPLIDAYKQIIPFFRQESELRALNLIKFIEKNKVYGIELWEKLIPKIKSEFRIDSDELEIKGIIDQIEVYPDGQIPIELKTGSMPKEGVWPGHRIQLGAYALLMEEKFGKEIKEGFVVYLDKQERRHIAINPYLKQEVKDIKDKVRELLEGKEVPAVVDNENKCAKCGLKEQCFDEKFLENKLKQL
jgi:CRISPR-associated protein Cas4